MNYKKLMLVGAVSAFVAILTSVLGVAGTIIGSVISSVLYNMLSEALEKPVSEAEFKHDFEWDLAYVFPLAVVALIQLLLIFALLSESGFLPYTFVNVYLSIQDLANNNLYRILGFAMLIISAYPLVLKPEFVKKEHGILLVFVGLIFLARGFVDMGNPITDMYGGIFSRFDLPIAILAFLIIVFVILRILNSAKSSEKEFKVTKKHFTEEDSKPKQVYNAIHSNKDKALNNRYVRNIRVKNPIKSSPDTHHGSSKPLNNQRRSNVEFKKKVVGGNDSPGFNKSSNNIHFESNDLLDDFKK
ncbi:hypothetical protein [Methanobrevibacter sp.]|uniref:hypothetical protein n=1 Tax=Methanobrevibacter sp. TaxID=66852 RepID=UPI0025E1150E|nr:hypothetical protein [Methanobrevibacter sp.]MBQ2831818.1 hypothetical protein [Methanobrevibacter sp.]